MIRAGGEAAADSGRGGKGSGGKGSGTGGSRCDPRPNSPRSPGTEAARLARDARAVPIVARFVGQWLHVDTDLRLADAAFGSSPVYLELLELVEHALANDVAVTSVVAAPRSFVHEDNLDAYGLADARSTDAVSLVTWAADSVRCGLLGQGLLAGG